ncbi:hypothetical protein ACFQAS_09565 [Halopenitus salinus]|uniref:Uncharacterized protein n=1 Tax=Halopenitus salinus TaxID=1198295 RepID=A0ABD5URU3_9EURY
MARMADRFDLDSLSPLARFGIVLALSSALVHLVLGVGFLPHPMGVAFLLATGGFLGAVYLLAMGYRRRLLYLVGIPFVGIQIVLWYVFNRPAGLSDVPAVHLLDKLVQVALIGVLVVLHRRER